MRDFLINVAAGVFLTVVSWFLVRWVKPFYFAWVHKAPALEGNWALFDSDAADAAPVGTATIEQSGENIGASVTRTKSRKGASYSRKFEYQGRVRHGQVLISFEEPTSRGFVAGSVVLKISGDFKTLTGFSVFLDHDAGSVVAKPVVFRRT